MGLFKTKPKLASNPRQLKTGAAVELVDVDPGFVEWVRSAKPLDAKRKEHTATVRLDYDGTDILARAAGGLVIGRMKPERVPQYAGEFAAMNARGEYGVADVAVSRADLKERYSILINFDAGCRDGGVL